MTWKEFKDHVEETVKDDTEICHIFGTYIPVKDLDIKVNAEGMAEIYWKRH